MTGSKLAAAAAPAPVAYSVNGTIGQHDAGGPMTGGNYSLSGGFWSLVSVSQTPGAPTLYMGAFGKSVTVYWQDVPGWSLQQKDSLASPGNWSASSPSGSFNGTNYLTILAPTEKMFFRLHHP